LPLLALLLLLLDKAKNNNNNNNNTRKLENTVTNLASQQNNRKRIEKELHFTENLEVFGLAFLVFCFIIPLKRIISDSPSLNIKLKYRTDFLKIVSYCDKIFFDV